MFVLASLGVGVAAYGASYMVDVYAQRAKARAAEAPSQQASGDASQQQQQQQQQAEAAAAGSGGGGLFSSLFSTYGRGFYEGGFEEAMTRREAALILGVRESATREKVREAHRRLALANHPDTGGSPYLAQKINEAKDVLLGTK